MRFILATALCLTPALAAAETDLERLERLTAAMSEKMYAYIVKEYPAADGNLPDPSWNDEIRSAANCALGEWESRLGSAEVERMMNDMEEALEDEITDFVAWTEEVNEMSLISDEVAMEIEGICGMGDATVNKMMSDPNMPNLMEAMAAAMGAG